MKFPVKDKKKKAKKGDVSRDYAKLSTLDSRLVINV